MDKNPDKCQHMMDNGEQCKSFPVTGLDLCYNHQAAGLQTEAPTIDTPEKLQDFTVQVMHQLSVGHITEKKAAVLKDFIALVHRQMAARRDVDNADAATLIAEAMADDSGE